jgi:hypothetical protein
VEGVSWREGLRKTLRDGPWPGLIQLRSLAVCANFHKDEPSYRYERYRIGIAAHFICLVLLEGGAVSELVEALCYKPEGRGFESR